MQKNSPSQTLSLRKKEDPEMTQAKLLKSDLFVATSRSPSCCSILYRSTLFLDGSDNVSMTSTYNDKYFKKDFPKSLGTVLPPSIPPLFFRVYWNSPNS